MTDEYASGGYTHPNNCNGIRQFFSYTPTEITITMDVFVPITNAECALPPKQGGKRRALKTAKRRALKRVQKTRKGRRSTRRFHRRR